MDENQKEQFIKLTHFLGQVLGKQYEVVFHLISKEGSYIAAIANSHISGRSLNSPLSAFASELIQNKSFLDEDFLLDYKASVGSKSVRGSTFFIKNGKELVGILCINHDTSVVRELICKIVDIEKIGDVGEILNTEKATQSVETLSRSIEDILASSVDESYINSSFQLSLEQKEELVKSLYEKGIFNIKGAVPKVANFLKLSEPSVYRYLKKFKQ